MSLMSKSEDLIMPKGKKIRELGKLGLTVCVQLICCDNYFILSSLPNKHERRNVTFKQIEMHQ